MVTFADLFEDLDSLILYHFVFRKAQARHIPPGEPALMVALSWQTTSMQHGCIWIITGYVLSVFLKLPLKRLRVQSRMNWNFPWFGRATDAFHGEVFSLSGEAVAPFRGVSVYLSAMTEYSSLTPPRGAAATS